MLTRILSPYYRGHRTRELARRKPMPLSSERALRAAEGLLDEVLAAVEERLRSKGYNVGASAAAPLGLQRRERKRVEPIFVTGWRSRERLPAARRGVRNMATAIQKITLSSARDIPFNKLALSQSNVRHVKAGVSIEELAESIARRGLIQSLHVRPVLDADGTETGMYEVPAGGRRYRALELLVKQKRLTIDVTPDMRGRIKIAAFRRGMTVADMLRDLLAREFPADVGEPS
jgi:hypothetical protein